MEKVNDFNNVVKSIKTTDDIASDLKVSVLTIGAELGSLIDLSYLFKKFEKNKHKKDSKNKERFDNGLPFKKYYLVDDLTYNDFTLKYKPECRKSAKKEVITRSNGGRSNKKQKSHFYNSLYISFGYKQSKNISVKVFPNGKIGITGNRNIEISHEIPVIIEKFIKKFKKCIKEPKKFGLKNQRIDMINSNFKFKSPIKQNTLKNLVNEYKFNGKTGSWRISTFQPGRYSGAKCKWWSEKAKDKYRKNIITGKKVPKKVNGQVSINIFRSGSVNIMGSKSSADLYGAYNTITTLVRNHQDEIFIKPKPDNSVNDDNQGLSKTETQEKTGNGLFNSDKGLFKVVTNIMETIVPTPITLCA
jgi:TATA-box binding protein (TBP) (component of TFIID and TFIIIB)